MSCFQINNFACSEKLKPTCPGHHSPPLSCLEKDTDLYAVAHSEQHIRLTLVKPRKPILSTA